MNRFIILLLLSALPCSAASVRNYMLDPFTGEVNTNALIIRQISTNILASGGVVGVGVPQRTPASPWTNTLSTGFYSVSNVALRSAYVINVTDSGPSLYDATNLLHSGFNTYVTLYGSNLPPTYDTVTNAIGFLPASVTQLNTASNALYDEIAASAEGISAATATNIAAYQAYLATNGFSSGNPNAITNSDSRALNFPGGVTSTALTSSGAIAAVSGIEVSAGRFDGDGAGITNVPLAGVNGLPTALDWLTNNGGGISQATASAMMADGTNSFAGNGGGLTNVTAAKLSQHIAAYYVTNYTENRDSIYVTGNGSSAVNGQYKVSWYNPDTFLGVWTNTASTNMILMNNPSNHGGIQGQPFVIAASTAPDDFLYQEDQTMLGVRSVWSGGLYADGMTAFAGTATLAWSSNAVRQIVLTSFAVGGTNSGIVATNLIRVSNSGSDETATRLNGYPYKTLYVASTNAQEYDMIYIEPGYHKTKPFHMDNRNFHILGAGQDVCVVEAENFQDGPDPFQSRALVPWDNCSIGGFTLTNSLIAFAQFSAPSGGTNVWAHDLTIYPPRDLKYPDNTDANSANGDQSQYFNVGFDVSRIGDNNRIERVKVYSGLRGFGFQATYAVSGTITLIDCEAYCAPEYVGSPNIWTNMAFVGAGATNVGGMLPLSIFAKLPAQTAYPFTLNIIGGNFVSLNGGTNEVAYVGGETQASRNASLWISRAYTNTVTINLSSVPRFRNGNTNTTSYAVLNEATNSNVTINGYYSSNHIAQTTNTVASIVQSVSAAGTQAISSGSMVTMNFGTTDPAITVEESGYYAIFATASGITSSADLGNSVTIQASSNSVTIPGSFVTYEAPDVGLASMVMPWVSAQPVAYSDLVAGDVVALQWQGSDTSWAATAASLSIVKLAEPAIVIQSGGGEGDVTSAQLIATNDLLVTRITAATNSLSGVLGTRIIATNDLLVTWIDAATNSLSGVLGTRIIATNDLLVTRITAATNSYIGKFETNTFTGSGALVRSNSPTLYNAALTGSNYMESLTVGDFNTGITNATGLGTDANGKLVNATYTSFSTHFNQANFTANQGLFYSFDGNYNAGNSTEPSLAATLWGDTGSEVVLTNLGFQLNYGATSVGTNWILYAVTNKVKSGPLVTITGTAQGTTVLTVASWTTESFTFVPGVTNVGWFITNSMGAAMNNLRFSISGKLRK